MYLKFYILYLFHVQTYSYNVIMYIIYIKKYIIILYYVQLRAIPSPHCFSFHCFSSFRGQTFDK